MNDRLKNTDIKLELVTPTSEFNYTNHMCLDLLTWIRTQKHYCKLRALSILWLCFIVYM